MPCRPPTSKRARGLAFECASGRVIKVKEAICWRYLEGRSCEAPPRRFSSAAAGGGNEAGEAGSRILVRRPDVVVVPIAPSVKERRAAQDVMPAEDEGSHDGPAVAACKKTYGPEIVRAAEAASAKLALCGDE